MINKNNSVDAAWIGLIRDVMQGDLVAPRGKATLELPQSTIAVSTLQPVLTLETRKLNYRFMAAEALWILSGRNTLEELTEINPRMVEFSDDGVTLAGAYGPPFRAQVDYVVDKLIEDRSSRQAGLTIWKPNPPVSKDIPCTVAIWFQLRQGKLNTHVFMRSNDVWLGTPYDLFTFSMMGWYVVNKLRLRLEDDLLLPGALYLTAASHHLYLEHLASVNEVLQAHRVADRPKPATPPISWLDGNDQLLDGLAALRRTKRGDALRWWEGAKLRQDLK